MSFIAGLQSLLFIPKKFRHVPDPYATMQHACIILSKTTDPVELSVLKFGEFYSWGHCKHGSATMRVFSVSRHFFKTNVTQSVAELILYSQKTQNCGHFLSNLMN